MFRIVAAVPFIVLLSSPAQAGEDTELEAMRATLAKADTLRITFQSEIETDTGRDSVKGVMTISKGNKARIEMKMSVGGKSADLTLISDGKMTQNIVNGKRPLENLTDANLRTNIITMIERGGVAIPLFVLRPFAAVRKDEGGPDLAGALKISNVTRKEGEKGVFRYALNVSGKAEFRVDLSLERDRDLPMRRVLEVAKGADRATVRETYTVEVDPMLPGDVFELRKVE